MCRIQDTGLAYASNSGVVPGLAIASYILLHHVYDESVLSLAGPIFFSVVLL